MLDSTHLTEYWMNSNHYAQIRKICMKLIHRLLDIYAYEWRKGWKSNLLLITHSSPAMKLTKNGFLVLINNFGHALTCKSATSIIFWHITFLIAISKVKKSCQKCTYIYIWSHGIKCNCIAKHSKQESRTDKTQALHN